LKVAIIEDEKLLNEALSMYLEMEGFEVLPYFSLKEFFGDDKWQDAKLIIADIHLPDGNFLEEVKKHPKIFENKKIMIISAQTEIDNIKKAFNLGAEDFIKKPFDAEEIALRINKIFFKDRVKISDKILYDFNTKSIIKENEIIPLSKKEADLLELFINNRGKVLETNNIIEHIWKKEVPNNTLTVLVKRVREKLGDKKLIVSKRDIGYMMF